MPDPSDTGRLLRIGLTPSHISAGLGVIALAICVSGGLVTLGSMRTRADATERLATEAKAALEVNTTRLAVHDQQFRALEAALARIEGKVDDALKAGARKP